MKNKIKKISNYFFNSNKKYNKIQLLSNWLVLILPMSFITIMLVVAANAENKTENQILNSNYGIIMGMIIIIWFVTLIWCISYKIYKRIKKKKK